MLMIVCFLNLILLRPYMSYCLNVNFIENAEVVNMNGYYLKSLNVSLKELKYINDDNYPLKKYTRKSTLCYYNIMSYIRVYKLT